MRFAFQSKGGKNPNEDYEDVFAKMADNETKTSPTSPSNQYQRQNTRENLSSLEPFNQRLPTNFCCAQWSVSNRCLDCAWVSQRGGRPAHPLPPLYSSSDESNSLVTLKSLGRRDDSGYEPSPTSLFSFSFASDDEDGNAEVFSEKYNEPSKGDNEKVINFNENVCETNKNEEQPKTVESSPRLTRAKSLPELWSSEKVLSRTPIMVRNNFLETPSRTPVHGRNCSLPVTTSDGKPIFVSPSTNQSQEGLIDLTKYNKGKSTGYNRRRVLVLALPDILVDINGSFPSTSKTPSDIQSSKRRAELSSTSSSPASYSLELRDSVSPRPTWRRPRALSCDVTLEVEFGQELRRVSDDFSRKSFREGSVLGALRRGFTRRLSLGENNRMSEILDEDRVSHSLPSSSAYDWL